VQWAHERAILWNTNNDSNSMNDQAITLTHNLSANFAGGQAYTMNTGFFSLYGAENNMTWLNTTGHNNTQYIQLATAKQNSLITSLSYGLQIGSPSLEIEPSLVLGGYDRSLCLTKPVTTQNGTFRLMDLSIGANGSGWPFLLNNTAGEINGTSSQAGLIGDNATLRVLANPGVPYIYLRSTFQSLMTTISDYISGTRMIHVTKRSLQPILISPLHFATSRPKKSEILTYHSLSWI
jgi:hypothetical protein